MDANSILGERHARSHRPKRGLQILDRLAAAPATTRMLAQQIGCQSSDLTGTVLHLRELGILLDAGTGQDPATGRKAHFWTIKPPTAHAAGSTA